MSDISDDEDVPPLEDLSEHFAQLEIEQQGKTGKVLVAGKDSTPTPPANVVRVEAPHTNGAHSKTKTVAATVVTTCSTGSGAKTSAKASSSFGGFSKGFLSGGNTTKKTASMPQHVAQRKSVTSSSTAGRQSSKAPSIGDSIPFITSQTKDKAATPEFTFPEVQEALKSSQPILADKDAWLTPDLQQAIATNSILGPKLADPKFASLLEEFQQDPQETLRKHADNPQMKSFLQEFCRIMGEHFTRLGEAQDQLSKATVQKDEEADLIRPVKTKSLKSSANASSAAQDDDQRRMTAILARPDVQQALQCPEIQQIIELARQNSLEAHERVKRGSREVQRHIQTLVKNGILGFNM